MLAIKLAGVAPETNLKNTMCAGDEAYKWEIRIDIETQDRHHQRCTREC